MAYSLIKLVENGLTVEGVVATSWIQGDLVYWPPHGVNSRRALIQSFTINTKWPVYKYLKTIFTDGKSSTFISLILWKVESIFLICCSPWIITKKVKISFYKKTFDLIIKQIFYFLYINKIKCIFTIIRFAILFLDDLSLCEEYQFSSASSSNENRPTPVQEPGMWSYHSYYE